MCKSCNTHILLMIIALRMAISPKACITSNTNAKNYRLLNLAEVKYCTLSFFSWALHSITFYISHKYRILARLPLIFPLPSRKKFVATHDDLFPSRTKLCWNIAFYKQVSSIILLSKCFMQCATSIFHWSLHTSIRKMILPHMYHDYIMYHGYIYYINNMYF